MKIAVRTGMYEVFHIFLVNFVYLYPERVQDLVAIVDEEAEKMEWFENLQNYLPLEIRIIGRQTAPDFLRGNYPANLLYYSLQYDEVISLDDDIIFLEPGFFDMVERSVPDSSVFGQRFFHTRDLSLTSLASYCIGTRNVPITYDDFDYLDSPELVRYDGNDAYKIYVNHSDHTRFLDIHAKQMFCGCGPTNFVRTDFYQHISGVEYSFQKITKKADFDLFWRHIYYYKSRKVLDKSTN